MTVSFCVGPRQPRSTSPSYRGRPAIIFGSAFVVPAVAETEQVSPAHGKSDLHRDRFEWTACLARSSSPLGTATNWVSVLSRVFDFSALQILPLVQGLCANRAMTVFTQRRIRAAFAAIAARVSVAYFGG